MFGRIAARYDWLNHGLSGGLDILWRGRLVQAVGDAGACVLDLASGTMDVALALARRCPDARIVCLDASRPMLERGIRKARIAEERGVFLPIEGNAFVLPFRDASLDTVTVAFGVRNMTPRSAVFAEIFRVVRPEGRFLMLEFGSAQKPVWFGLYNAYLLRILPWLGKMFGHDATAYAYLAATIRDFPPAATLDAELYHAGFDEVTHESLCGGIVYLHRGRKRA